MPTNLILQNRLSPGDILMMTPAIRDLHLSYPGEFTTDVRSPAPQVFNNNPYVTPLKDGEGRLIDMQYELIHVSGATGRHFSEGHREHLAQAIGKPIKNTSMWPEIYLSETEKNWASPAAIECGYDGPYWLINAGIKNDYTLKKYPYYQEVVNLLHERITFVQVGQLEHNHPPLEHVLDMRGKTDLRQLFRLSYHSDGAICAVSLQMVVQAAFRKPCVVLNGGRESIRWQAYQNHRFLAVNGSLPCCRLDGCWKSKPDQCVDWLKEKNIPHCMDMIKPEHVAAAVETYYEGGVLEHRMEYA